MTIPFRLLPRWCESTLQGLAFWMGYRQQCYGHHSLTEGAINTAFTELLFAHTANVDVRCEKQYKKFLPQKKLGPLITSESRADIVLLCPKPGTGKIHIDQAQIVIEIKRYSSSAQLINDDINRLSEAIGTAPYPLRGFLLVTSQGKRPRRYTNKKGVAKTHILQTCQGVSYKVRRVCKAAGSFRLKENAHYVCLIEIA